MRNRAGDRLRRLGRGLRIWLVVVPVLLVAAGCSGGGGADDSAGLDQEFRPTPGERNVQFTGATKLRLAGTLAVPAGATGPVPAVLIIPAPGATTRDGPLVARPSDSLYKDLSAALTGAGMATFRYDHRGIGESQLGPGQELTWDDMVDDAREALAFLAQRQEVDGARVAVIGHDMAGPIALRLAAADDRVKGVALLSAPGRPLIDVWADGYRASHGPASSDAFRALIGGLLATGSLPGREAVAPEYQTNLPPGQDAFFRGMFSADPLADAAAVKVPVLLALGERSTQVSSVDATRLSGALGGRTETVVAANSSATFQQFRPAPVRVSDPGNMDDHGLGPPVADAPRDQPTIDRIASFIASALRVGPA